MKLFILCIYYNLKNVKPPKHTEDISILNGSYNPVQNPDTDTSVFPSGRLRCTYSVGDLRAFPQNC